MKCDASDCQDPSATTLILAPVMATEDEESPPPVFLCMSCVQRRGLWCEEHQLVHVGFTNGGHACIKCIEADVRANTELADSTAKKLETALVAEGWEELTDWAELAASVMGDSGENIAILRILLTTAHRRKVTLEQVIDEVCSTKDVSAILPPLV